MNQIIKKTIDFFYMCSVGNFDFIKYNFYLFVDGTKIFFKTLK